MYDFQLNKSRHKDSTERSTLNLYKETSGPVMPVIGNAAGLRLIESGKVNGAGIIQRGKTSDEILGELPESVDTSDMTSVIEVQMGNTVKTMNFGLVVVHYKQYTPEDGKLVAEHHVKSKGDGESTLTRDIYQALNNSLEDPNVEYFWMNPTGVQVVKGMVEILGKSVGDPIYAKRAEQLRDQRRSAHKRIVSTAAIDRTVVPEHEMYLRSLYLEDGLTIRSQAVPGEGKFKNMMQDSEVFASHINALRQLNEMAASLNITFNRDIATRVKNALEAILAGQ